MVQLSHHTIPHAILVATVAAVLSGCASVSDIQDVRNLPGFTEVGISQENTFYDPPVRAYRRKPTEKDERVIVLRGVGGRKIQTEEELARFIEARQKELFGTGTGVAVRTLFWLYGPVLLSFKLVDFVLGLPVQPLLSHIDSTYKQEAEHAYTSGRRHFDSGEVDTALANWERARYAMPSLQAFSDIEYWRGRAFEARGQVRDARVAYELFLNYSEQSVPDYFKEKYPKDQTWAEKADDAERRSTALKDTPRSAPEAPK